MTETNRMQITEILKSEEYPNAEQLSQLDRLLSNLASGEDLRSCVTAIACLEDDLPFPDLAFLVVKTVESFSADIEAQAFWASQDQLLIAPESMFTLFVRMTNSKEHSAQLLNHFEATNVAGLRELENAISRHIARGKGTTQNLQDLLQLIKQ
jgi:hypothetical protein